MGEHGAVLISLGVRLWRAHVPLGVAGVVAVPVGHGGPAHTDFEDLGGAHHGHAGHVAAVAPAVDPHARGIDIGELREFADGGYLVVDFDRAHSVGDGGFEGEAAVRASPVVDLQDHETLLREVLGAKVHRQRPLVERALDVRAAVDRDNDRVALARFEDRRAEDGAVEERAIGGIRGGELGDGKAELRRRCSVVREQHLFERPIGGADGDAWAVLAAVPCVDEPRTVLREDHAVDAGLARELRHLAAAKRDPVEVAFEHGVLRPGEVDVACLFVDVVEAGDDPVAARERGARAIGAVTVEVVEAGAFALPEEAAIVEEAGVAVEVDPGRLALFVEDGGRPGGVECEQPQCALVA